MGLNEFYDNVLCSNYYIKNVSVFNVNGIKNKNSLIPYTALHLKLMEDVR